MHFKQVAEFLGVGGEQLLAAAERAGVAEERLQSRRLERGDIELILRWTDALALSDGTGWVGATTPAQRDELRKRLTYLTQPHSRFRTFAPLDDGLPKVSSRTEPATSPAAFSASNSAKTAFSLFVTAGTSKANDLGRLLAEISKLQEMLGGCGIEYRLAGVLESRAKSGQATQNIIRWEALPRPKLGGRLSRRDVFAMEIIGRLLGAKTIQVDALGDDYVKGQAVEQTHPARIIASEAVNFAGKAAINPSAAESRDHHHAAVRWLAKLSEIEKLDSRSLQFLTVAKLFDETETLTVQLSQIMEIIQLLRAISGAKVEIEMVERKDPVMDPSRPYFTPLEIELN